MENSHIIETIRQEFPLDDDRGNHDSGTLVASSVSLIGYMLFFLMIVFPMVIDLLYVKAGMFAMLLACAGLCVIKFRRFGAHPKVMLLAGFFVLVGIGFSLRGALVDAPGAFKQAFNYGLWPAVYIIIGTEIHRLGIFYNIGRVVAISSMVIGLFGILFTLNQLDIIQNVSFIDIITVADETRIGREEGYLEIAFPGLHSLVFILPFLFTALIVKTPLFANRLLSKLFVLVPFCLLCALALLSGRRGILLSAVLAPVFAMTFRAFLPAADKVGLRRQIAFMVISAVAVFLYLNFSINQIRDFNLSTIFEMFIDGFNFQDQSNESAYARQVQFIALLNGWFEDPILGAGFGAFTMASIRTEEMPWAYELYYMGLLFQTGLVGFLSYTGGVIWIYINAIRIIKEGGQLALIMLPVLVGLTGTLVATASNPYLVRFDGIWAIFWPIALINYWLVMRAAEPAPAASPRRAESPSSPKGFAAR